LKSSDAGVAGKISFYMDDTELETLGVTGQAYAELHRYIDVSGYSGPHNLKIYITTDTVSTDTYYKDLFVSTLRDYS